MDVLTHGLLGATLARATEGSNSRWRRRERLALGGLAAMFPDVDFALFPLDPLRFLADWHQGPTHSLVLLPLWALLIGGIACALAKRREGLAEAVLVSGLGVASHIGADVITAYGTAVFHPLSRQRFGLGSSFVIDPLFSLIVLAGLGCSLWSGRRLAAVAGLTVLGLYVVAQLGLQRRAVEIGRASAQAQGQHVDTMSAWAQPFSPFNWKLVGTDGTRYREAHLDLAGHGPLVPDWPGLGRVRDIAAAYRPAARLEWRERPRLGEPAERALVEALWNDSRFAPFRRFAVYPLVSRIESQGGETCVWFTDLRYDVPALPDTFRYGFCRDAAGAPWGLYRLRYFTDGVRQKLPR